MKNNKSVQKL